jgi:hypothetical protein
MEAEVLHSFIKKYYLDGAVEEAKWLMNKDGINIKFLSTVGDCVGEIKVNIASSQDDTEVGILNTSALLSMVDILGGLTLIEIEKSASGIPMKMILSDSNYETYYHLADLNLFRKVPRVQEPPYHVEININSEFATKFIRGKGALDKNITRCTIESGKQNNTPGLKIEIGGKESLSHKVKFFHEDASCKGGVNKQSFNADIFKSIFQANKNFDSGVFKISNEGLACLTLITGPIECIYFIVKMVDE